jgi:hydroxyacylglutathione hydrolase
MRLDPLPAFDDNYIWTLGDAVGRSLIVDPGDAAPVFAAADRGLQPCAVLITHHHADHIGGLRALLERWPRLPVYAPEDERISQATHRVGDGDRVLIDGMGVDAAGVDSAVVDGDSGWAFEVIAVPGHTRSHIAYFGRIGGRHLLFCGDTLFSLGCGRLFEGTPGQMLASLDRLAARPADTLVCCTHEYTLSNAAFASVVDGDNPTLRLRIAEARAARADGRPTLPTTLAEERAANPFLRSDNEAVRNAVAEHIGRTPVDRLDTFTQLRLWKDGFRG